MPAMNRLTSTSRAESDSALLKNFSHAYYHLASEFLHHFGFRLCNYFLPKKPITTNTSAGNENQRS